MPDGGASFFIDTYGPWLGGILLALVIFAIWNKDTLIGFFRRKADLSLDRNGARHEFEQQLRSFTLDDVRQNRELIQSLLEKHERETQRYIQLYESERLDRKSAQHLVMDHAGLTQQVASQFVEVMIDQVDILRTYVGRLESVVSISESIFSIAKSLEKQVEQQNWLLIRLNFAAEGDVDLQAVIDELERQGALTLPQRREDHD